MRLWHKDLITLLPNKQLIAQWRELCAIAKNIDKKGTPNHLLVNKVLDYPPLHFILYANAVIAEMRHRNFKPSEQSYETFASCIDRNINKFDMYTFQYVPNEISDAYRDWHNDRYLVQCYHNLEEKYDCGGIPKDEWLPICNKYKGLI